MPPTGGHPQGSLSGPQPLRWARVAADLLTAGRLAAAGWILLLGWQGAHAHDLLLWALLGWSTDVLDGPLARRSHTPPSCLGMADMAIDMFLAGATAAGLALAGFVPGWMVAGWTAAAAAVYWRRPRATVRLIWAAGLDLVAIWAAWVFAPGVFRLFLAWAALVAILASLGGRLRNTVGDFVAGLAPAGRDWFDAHLPRWLGGGVQAERRAACHGPEPPP